MNTTTFFVSRPAECFKILGNEITALRKLMLDKFLEALWFDDEDFDIGALMEMANFDAFKTKEDMKQAILNEESLWLDVPEEFADQDRSLLIMDVACNSVMATEDPLFQLIARVVGQRWTHAYVERENFSWLFDLIQEALDKGYLSEKRDGLDTGWTALMSGLSDLEGPLVIAGDNGFPNKDFCPLNRGEEFDDLDVKDRWERSLNRLRENPEKYRWQPSDFGEFRFGDKVDAKGVLKQFSS